MTRKALMAAKALAERNNLECVRVKSTFASYGNAKSIYIYAETSGVLFVDYYDRRGERMSMGFQVYSYESSRDFMNRIIRWTRDQIAL